MDVAVNRCVIFQPFESHLALGNSFHWPPPTGVSFFNHLSHWALGTSNSLHWPPPGSWSALSSSSLQPSVLRGSCQGRSGQWRPFSASPLAPPPASPSPRQIPEQRFGQGVCKLSDAWKSQFIIQWPLFTSCNIWNEIHFSFNGYLSMWFLPGLRLKKSVPNPAALFASCDIWNWNEIHFPYVKYLYMGFLVPGHTYGRTYINSAALFTSCDI